MMCTSHPFCYKFLDQCEIDYQRNLSITNENLIGCHRFYFFLQIEDRRTELYVGDTANFPGQGYRLGKQSAVDSLLSTDSRRSNNVFQRSGRISPLPKDNAFENIPLLSLQTNRYYHCLASVDKYLKISHIVLYRRQHSLNR